MTEERQPLLFTPNQIPMSGLRTPLPIGGARPLQGRVSYVVCIRGPFHPPLDPWLARTLRPWLEPWFVRLLVGESEQPLHRLSVPWFEPQWEPRLHRPSVPQLH